MAKVWCTVPRMIFVGGFAQPAVLLTGATAKKHFTRICQNQSFEEKTANSCRNGPGHRMASSQHRKDFWWRLS